MCGEETGRSHVAATGTSTVCPHIKSEDAMFENGKIEAFTRAALAELNEMELETIAAGKRRRSRAADELNPQPLPPRR
jgi:hypothetical protein